MAPAARWLAVLGSVLSAVAIALLMVYFMSVLTSLSGDSTIDWVSTLPGAVGVAIYLAIAYGLARRSRMAFVVAFLINGWSLIGLISTSLMGGGLFRTTIPYLVGIPAAMVVIGLGLSWRWYWQRPQVERGSDISSST